MKKAVSSNGTLLHHRLDDAAGIPSQSNLELLDLSWIASSSIVKY